MTCKCGNEARYINERGELCCSLCPLKEGLDSIKLNDVPKLLVWARRFESINLERELTDTNFEELVVRLDRSYSRELSDLRSIVGRKP